MQILEEIKVLAMSYIIIIPLFLVSCYLFSKILVWHIIYRTKKKFILPILKSKNYKLSRIKAISNLFVWGGGSKRGDFDNEPEILSEDTKLHRKFYIYLFYFDNEQKERKITIKIHLDAALYPYKMETLPPLV